MHRTQYKDGYECNVFCHRQKKTSMPDGMGVVYQRAPGVVADAERRTWLPVPPYEPTQPRLPGEFLRVG